MVYLVVNIDQGAESTAVNTSNKAKIDLRCSKLVKKMQIGKSAIA
jgi:hypothetical protein